ncbi:hypothetical protein TNIN_84441 [Trichonephila inaurata madagascariensis]|uniref:Uncharacterized protein n=1 Tax=Trichonephila inaurata madagascariensis TaxID=2747483 RepID=A0A8X6IAM4_9ARAC|nr:hypothetical protein TNIN_84441 [Trichonephila inaurata madagascariensis]
MNRLKMDIKNDINNIKRLGWDDSLVESNMSDVLLHKLLARANKIPVIYPLLLGYRGLIYGTKEKANLFMDALEDSFQENRTPYDDDHIVKVDRSFRRFLRHNILAALPLTSPFEIYTIITNIEQ